MTPQRIFDLYDEYCHGGIDRREFIRRAGAMGMLAAATALLPDYARAQQVSFTDPRIRAAYVTYPSPGGNGGTMRGYLVHPASPGPHAAVLVVHENRGLNPYIEDVARRVALEGYLALAPDALTPLGGYPGNDDDGREMQSKLDPAKLRIDMANGARWVKAHPGSSGKLGVTGFCMGGGVANYVATQLGGDLQAGAPFYGDAPPASAVSNIKAAMLLHFAENDPRINGMWPGYERALKAAGVRYEAYVYPGTQHGFHNDSTPRYRPEAAKLAWERTMAHFRKSLA